jgi:hypothetical protein
MVQKGICTSLLGSCVVLFSKDHEFARLIWPLYDGVLQNSMQQIISRPQRLFIISQDEKQANSINPTLVQMDNKF